MSRKKETRQYIKVVRTVGKNISNSNLEKNSKSLGHFGKINCLLAVSIKLRSFDKTVEISCNILSVVSDFLALRSIYSLFRSRSKFDKTDKLVFSR